VFCSVGAVVSGCYDDTNSTGEIQTLEKQEEKNHRKHIEQASIDSLPCISFLGCIKGLSHGE